MGRFTRPIVVVSKCLGFENCRWNAQIIANDFVKQLANYAEFRPICPEIEIGLGVPRNPVRIVEVGGENRLIQPATGADLTTRMKGFADGLLMDSKEVDGFLLKGGSPSCGIKNVKIYTKIDAPGIKEKGAGLFGKAVISMYKDLAIEDDERLANVAIREHFLAKLFTLSSFREVVLANSIRELIRFHTENKFLLMAYNQKEMRAMGKIVADSKELGVGGSISDYGQHLKIALSRPPKAGTIVNVLMHMMGFFKDLKKDEKSFFLDTLQAYREGRSPLIVSVSIIKSWAIRLNKEYLLDQTFLEPYPQPLLGAPTYDRDRDFWRFL